MRIDQSDAGTEQVRIPDERKHAFVCFFVSAGKSGQLFQRLRTRAEVTQRQLANDEWMTQHGSIVEQ